MDRIELNAFIGEIQHLVETLRVVSSRIENNRLTYNGNETNTRNGLINPVLGRLGWDVTDPELVSAEHPMGGGRVDYALKVNDVPIAVVEAKNLGSRLRADVTAQLLNYISDTRSVKYAIATNGDSWQMQIRGERRLSLDLNLTEQQEFESALELMKISRLVIQPADVLSTQEHATTSPPQPDPVTCDWLTFDELEFKGKSPNLMMLPDGQQVPISSWKTMWITIAEWVIERYHVEGEVLFGKNPNYMAIRTEDVGFWDGFGEQLSNGLWVIGGSLNSRNVRRCSRALLAHFGIDANEVRFRFK